MTFLVIYSKLIIGTLLNITSNLLDKNTSSWVARFFYKTYNPMEIEKYSSNPEPQEPANINDIVPENLQSTENNMLWHQKLGAVATGFRIDWQNNNTVGRIAQIGAITGQAAERLKLSEVLIAPMVVSVFNQTNSPPKTAVAAFGMVFAMQGFIGSTWAEAMDKSPETVERLNQHYPKMLGYAEDIGTAKNRRWYSHIREAYSTFFSLGVTPFIVAEKIQNPDVRRNELLRKAAALSGKCALVGAGLGYGLSEIVLSQNHQNAGTILDYAGNPLVWMSLALGLEVPRFVGKRIERSRKYKKSSQLA